MEDDVDPDAIVLACAYWHRERMIAADEEIGPGMCGAQVNRHAACGTCGVCLGEEDLASPEGVSERAMRAHAVIVRILVSAGRDNTAGCRAFYSPKEWRERGEDYGGRSELVIVYDGGDVGQCCRMDGALYERTRAALEPLGLYIEECTGWYAAVYSDRA